MFKTKKKAEECGIPLVETIITSISRKIKKNKIGFIYIGLANAKKIISVYGQDIYEEIVISLINTMKELHSSSILMKEDIIAKDSLNKDSFLIFLDPSSRYFLTLEDNRLILHKILHKLNEHINETGKITNDKVEFQSGCSFIYPDQSVSTSRLIYEAYKESLLNNRLQEFMRKFINNISHELRTPLTSIKGYVDTLIDGAMNEADTCMRFLKIINFETNRLVSLTSELLDLSLLQSGLTEMKIEPLEIKNLISKCLLLIKPYGDKKKLRIIYNSNQDYIVMADGDRIVQVILNILDNAIRYSPEYSEIEINLLEYNGYIKIEIIDHGCGISENNIPQIFEIFERVDTDRSLKKGGRGLGLTIAKNIVELHGGIINVESELGKGSKFYFLLKKG